MKISTTLLLAAALMWIPFAVSAQESAGRVLVAAGDVVIVRGAQRIPASAGAEVRAGDTLELGSQSNAQIRFTDESIVALRSDTTFRISEYAFQGQEPSAQRAFFNLVKGGMRTITGLIGRTQRQNYGVQTLVATIGIRGTHYALCHDCRNPDGSVEQGTLGAVTLGRLGVTNESGEHQFATDQYFQVTTVAAPPETLLAPPPALRDALEGRVRAKQREQQAAAGQEKQAAAAAAATVIAAVAPAVDVAIASSIVNAATAAALTTNVFQVTNQAATSTEGLSSVLQPALTGTHFYRLAGPFNIPTSCANPPCSPVVAGEITLGVNLALQRATVAAALLLGDGGIFNISVPGAAQGVPITISGNRVTFAGTLNIADFPENRGAFRCSDCGPNNTPGFFSELSFSGVITGAQATVTIAGRDADGAGSLTATLPLVTAPNNTVAAMAIQRNDGGTDARSAGFWNVQVDAAGRLLQFGPNVGGPAAVVGNAANVIAGSAPGAGNLVWGTWTGPDARFTDSNYDTYTSPATGRLSVQPWITGDAPNTLPPSLGILTYTPVGSVFTSANQRLNSASLTADFMSRSLSVSINATNLNGGNTYQMNGTTAFNPANSRFSSGFATVNCTGPCNNGTGSADGSFGGFFAGAQAQGAGVAFSAGFGAAAVPGVAGNGVTGAVGFKR